MELDYNQPKTECPRYDCKKNDKCQCLSYFEIPAVLGDDSEGSDVAPKNGAYCNAIVKYAANNSVYLYSSEGVPTRVEEDLWPVINEMQDDIDDLGTGLADETAAREAADAAIEQEIEDLRNEPDVVDIVGTYAELQAYDTSDLGDKDIIRVLVDEMHDNESTYYRWNKTPQTWTYIGAVEGYYTRGQTDALLDEKQDTLTAGANIQINNNVISATDTTYTHFTGATASTDGVQGLVPGPLAGDEDKFLKADGTWGEIAIDGQVTTLTADDYNWNRTAGDDTTLPLDSIALWKLTPGWYRTDVGMQVLRYKTTDYSYCPKDVFILVLGDNTSGPTTTIPNYMFKAGSINVALPQKSTGILYEKAADKTVAFTSILGEMHQASVNDYNWNSQTQSQTNPDCFAIWRYNLDNHPKTITTSLTNVQIQEYKGGPLVNGVKSPIYLRSMKVGSNPVNTFKIDSDGAYRITTDSSGNLLAYETLATIEDIDNRILTNAGAPTTATVGTVGQLLEDTTNGKLYICTDATDPYVWEEVGSGGSSSGVSDVQIAGTSIVNGGVANIDYASASKVGVIRTNTDYGTSVTSVGALISATKTYQQYQDTTTPNMFISKGTLENVITGKGLVDQTALATKQDKLTAGANITIDANNVISATGGSSGPTVVQTTGTSTADVMSQNATTSMVFTDPSTRQNVRIGADASVTANTIGVAIGKQATASNTYAVALGAYSQAADVNGVAIGYGARGSEPNSVGLGSYATPSRGGEVNVGTGTQTYGYNNTSYRLIGGVHDPVAAHDAATKGYVDGLVGNIAAALNAINNGGGN